MPILSAKTVTLDLSTFAIRLMMFNGNRIIRWSSCPIEGGLMEQGIIQDTTIIGNKIRRLAESSGILHNRVIVSTNGLFSVSRILHIHKTEGFTEEELIIEAAEKIWHSTIARLYLSWSALIKNDTGHNALVIGTPKNSIDTELMALDAARLKPYIMTPKGIALLKLVTGDQGLIANMEYDCLNIVLVAGGMPQKIRSIQRHLKITYQEWIHDIIHNINQTIAFYTSRSFASPISHDIPLYLTGIISEDPDIFRQISAETYCQVKPISIPFSHPPNLPVGEFAINIGLAIRSTQVHNMKVSNDNAEAITG